MENKTDLRARIKTQRKTLDIKASSKIIAEKIRKHPTFVKAQNVMLYHPLKYEINLLELMYEKKNFYFPKVNETALLVCPAEGEFKLSAFNIYEPCSNPVSPALLDLIIVPALGVDKEGFRLGYGGGFYDRFLAENNGITTLCPVFKEFVFEHLPHEIFDIQMDFVITD